MSFPTVIFHNGGQYFETQTAQAHPFGTKMITQDGREFRYGSHTAVALVAGRLCQMEVPGANFDELVIPTAQAIGAKAITVTNGATTVTANQFAGGYMNIEDDTGEGHLYPIESNDAEAAGSANFVVNLKHGLRVAITTATTVGLTKHPFKDMLIHPSPPTAMVTGVTPGANAASGFGWFQVRGPASVLGEGTLVIARGNMPSASADGAVTPWTFTLTEGTPNVVDGTEHRAIVGWTMEVAATTEESLVFLKLD